MEITHPDDLEEDQRNTDLLHADGPQTFIMDKRYIRPDGQAVWVRNTVTSVKDSHLGSSMHLCLTEDMEISKHKEEEILYLNQYDILTGLFNRASFDAEKVLINIPVHWPISIIVGDINGLKLINNSFGFVIGDQLLKDVADILRKCCREEDILARIGGDEYCFLLPNTSSETAGRIQKRIEQVCMEIPLGKGAESVKASISFGSSTKEDENLTFDEILRQAEDQMNRRKLLERRSLHSSIIASIHATLLEKSRETEQHAERLITLTSRIGEAMALSDGQLNDLSLLAALHDIGKIGIDDYILTKPGQLTEQEWVEMKKHPSIGYRIAQASPDLLPIAEYILSHHEYWNGKGYPQGLTGESIPLLSRILSVADAYDAMTQNRPYRLAMSSEEAISEISRSAGTQFDPEVVTAFLRIIGDDSLDRLS
ncbi:MAG TPA: HD domain-containing phosphohydrolase [Clostridia bacterium]